MSRLTKHEISKCFEAAGDVQAWRAEASCDHELATREKEEEASHRYMIHCGMVALAAFLIAATVLAVSFSVYGTSWPGWSQGVVSGFGLLALTAGYIWKAEFQESNPSRVPEKTKMHRLRIIEQGMVDYRMTHTVQENADMQRRLEEMWGLR